MKGRLDVPGLVADHDGRRVGAHRPEGPQDVLDEGEAEHGQENLGPSAARACPLAGSEHEGLDGGRAHARLAP